MEMCPQLDLSINFDSHGLKISQVHFKNSEIIRVYHGIDILGRSFDIKHEKISFALGNKVAEWIDYAHKIDLIHGDIHAKNVIFVQNLNDDEELTPILIDWEPNLVQSNGFVIRKMVTQPWHDDQDKKNGIIGKRTDWLCFHHMITSNKEIFYKSKNWLNILDDLENSSLKNKTSELLQKCY